MRFPFLAAALVFALPALAQDVPPEASGEETEIVETPPELIGGMAGLARRVVYPGRAIDREIQGKVFVQFIVDEEGVPTEPECVRSPHDLLCEAAIKAVTASRFVPGTQRGEAVKVRFTLPVDFRLVGDTPSPVKVAEPPEASGAEKPTEPQVPADGIYEIVEVRPVLVGGLANFQRKVRYPEKARRASIQGTIYVRFVVDETGMVRDPECVRSIDRDLCVASIEAVQGAVFTPGYVGGEAVKVRFTIPVAFKLR